MNAEDTDVVVVTHDDEAEDVQQNFKIFLKECRDADGQEKYGPMIDELANPERNTLTVDFMEMETHNSDMTKLIMLHFYRMYPYLCTAVKLLALDRNVKNCHNKELYVSIENLPVRHKVRELTSDKIGTLVKISGQVVRTHPVHPELCRGYFICDECSTPTKGVEQQFKYTQPSKCTNPTCTNRYRFQLDLHKSLFIDFQKARIQETQAELPRGSIPRSVEIILRGECVERAQPGDRCDFTGTLIVIPDVAQLATPGTRAETGKGKRGQGHEGIEGGLKGLKALGVRELNYKLAFLACAVTATTPRFGGCLDVAREQWTAEEVRERMSDAELTRVKEMADDRRIMENMIDSLFPSIYGSDEVKKGVLLMLFGGVGKRTAEGTTLRGDINVCIVGDPSTAKSQMLKIVEEFSPRAVYTSGKASTAAGLTAAVVKDEESNEFVIEAGALMLADNGVCCIDEFDKMELKDQVAIHEAMEQQTISITKAGVKATLNARSSILAAANPISGRYDKSRSLRQNIQLSAPIMSRFDLFFVLVDECNEVVDYAIAKRILDIHKDGLAPIVRKYSVEDIRKYIMFARCFKPKINESAVSVLVDEYKRLRQRDASGSASSSWRITVRQLESLVRLSEALARLHCDDNVKDDYVKEASRLLSKSIIRVEQPDVALEEDQLATTTVDAAELVLPDNGDAVAMEAADDESAKIPVERLKLTFDEYSRLSNLLVLHLRRQEQQEAVDAGGVKHSELIEWYLNEIEEEIDDEQELVIRKTIIEKVILRLINNDNILIPLTSTDGGSYSDDPVLVVHPNYVMEDE